MILVVVIAGCGGEMAPMPVDGGPPVFLIGDAGYSLCGECQVRCGAEGLLTPQCEPLSGHPADACAGCEPSCFVVQEGTMASRTPAECPGFPERSPTECLFGFHACLRPAS